MPRVLPTLLSLLVVIHIGCSDPQALDCVCTLEMRTVTVRVEDAAGNPVTGIEISGQAQFTGADLVLPNGLHPSLPGVYVIYSDEFVSDTNERGDSVRIVGKRDGRVVFDEVYVFGLDACMCHIEKRSGPDVIIVNE